jgi:hypothetical protein
LDCPKFEIERFREVMLPPFDVDWPMAIVAFKDHDAGPLVSLSGEGAEGDLLPYGVEMGTQQRGGCCRGVGGMGNEGRASVVVCRSDRLR